MHLTSDTANYLIDDGMFHPTVPFISLCQSDNYFKDTSSKLSSFLQASMARYHLSSIYVCISVPRYRTFIRNQHTHIQILTISFISLTCDFISPFNLTCSFSFSSPLFYFSSSLFTFVFFLPLSRLHHSFVLIQNLFLLHVMIIVIIITVLTALTLLSSSSFFLLSFTLFFFVSLCFLFR